MNVRLQDIIYKIIRLLSQYNGRNKIEPYIVQCTIF
jgi:hypothetical protein